MTQSHLLQSPWPSFNNLASYLNDFEDNNDLVMDDHSNHYDDSAFSISPAIFPSYFPLDEEELDFEFPINAFPVAVENFDIDNMFESIEHSKISFPNQDLSANVEDKWSPRSWKQPSKTSMDDSSGNEYLNFPNEELQLDNELSIIHLVKAYGEAMDEEKTKLSEVILKRLREKSSPVGGAIERALFYLFQSHDKQADFLKQESCRNFLLAFKAFYQILPYGQFAHFSSNRAILEAIPHDAEILRIIDFDIGEGIQWSSMIETIGFQKREIKITSIKWRNENSNSDPSCWSFDDTKQRLCDEARSFGLKLTIDNVELGDLVNQLKRRKKNGERREFLVFNCLVGIPHMGRVRSRTKILEFLKMAKEFLAYNSNCNYSKMGIITFGDGSTWVNPKVPSGFSSFLDENLVHYQALLESMERAFPIHLGEARTALECLFVGPLLSSLPHIKGSKEMTEFCDFVYGFEMNGCQVSTESLMEAKEIVREGATMYGVKIEGENGNVMVLDWRGTPLVRVSCWRSS